MKTVRILSGGYGLKDHGTKVLIRRNETCSVEDDEAEYLVSVGAAVIIGEAKAPEASAPVDPEDDEPEGEDEEALDEELQLETMTNKQLEAICKEMGINTKTLTNKTKLINAIRAKQDEMPDLGAEDFE